MPPFKLSWADPAASEKLVLAETAENQEQKKRPALSGKEQCQWVRHNGCLSFSRNSYNKMEGILEKSHRAPGKWETLALQPQICKFILWAPRGQRSPKDWRGECLSTGLSSHPRRNLSPRYSWTFLSEPLIHITIPKSWRLQSCPKIDYQLLR